ncbi:MAG: M20/M25/M40 family metallo-hydrolase [Gemmatimonadetes bacterium]|nr:M20/M25/M40 family metallo-hydrolase [Gemmatimonadota bacterium]
MQFLKPRVLLLITIAAHITVRTAVAQGSSAASDRIISHISFLADDAREGRGVGTTGLEDAAEYIAERFAEIGLQGGTADGFLQRFVISPTAPAAAHTGIGGVAVSNVVAIIPGRGSLRGQAVVVGAHYDHLGYGGFGSLDPDSVRVIHNGADDNASGTAALIEVARQIQARDGERVRSVVFVAFTAEEAGLIGSDYYVKNPIVPNDSTFAMLNMDMVGYLTDDRLTAFGAETAEEFSSLLESINVDYRFRISAIGDGYGRSDQQSFFVQKIPVLHFFTGTHENYHRTTDDADLINADGIARVASLVADLTWNLATRTEPLTFVDAAPPQVATSGGYGAYLGTIPDMSDSPGGVRLTGVRSGSPADQAGIRAGDIIIQIATFEVADLYAMTDALRALEPGDTVAIKVRRGDEVIEVEATLGRRGG